jgi:hypothetical protein
MKSVVVEASTVAKAIETAWLKAEKPEEFFIRVLQEHQSGFLGFGAQKAKIVLFFKNLHKSDALFPIVLKQKEYISFFGNNNLKTPTEINVIDTELNKNVSLGGGHQKKKQHNNNQQKNKQSNPSSDARPQHQNHGAAPVKSAVDKAIVPKPVHKQNNHGSIANQQSDSVNQVDIQNKVKQQHQQKPKNQQENLGIDKPKMQVSVKVLSQVVEQKAAIQLGDKKDDVVKNIAKVLKKVQTQKIVANVSRPTYKTSPDASRPATPKFENYADYAKATIDKFVVMPDLGEVKDDGKEILKPVLSNNVTLQIKSEDLGISPEQTAAISATPRPVLKMKRRPLTTENQGVSGITRSASIIQVKQDVSTDNSVQLAASDDNKNEKE